VFDQWRKRQIAEETSSRVSVPAKTSDRRHHLRVLPQTGLGAATHRRKKLAPDGRSKTILPRQSTFRRKKRSDIRSVIRRPQTDQPSSAKTWWIHNALLHPFAGHSGFFCAAYLAVPPKVVKTSLTFRASGWRRPQAPFMPFLWTLVHDYNCGKTPLSAFSQGTSEISISPVTRCGSSCTARGRLRCIYKSRSISSRNANCAR
jgi:hypothetical protein